MNIPTKTTKTKQDIETLTPKMTQNNQPKTLIAVGTPMKTVTTPKYTRLSTSTPATNI